MRLVAGIVFYAASSKLEIDCDCQSTEKRSILWNAPSSVTLHATLHPLKRSILCNAPCSETPNQRMRRFRGFGVSRLIGISRSICKSEDAANGRIRQISRSASSIIWDNDAFERIGISRSICKSHDAAICMNGHFTRDRKMWGWAHFTHCRSFSQVFSHTLLILANS
mgnify:CR=1 FL=1